MNVQWRRYGGVQGSRALLGWGLLLVSLRGPLDRAVAAVDTALPDLGWQALLQAPQQPAAAGWNVTGIPADRLSAGQSDEGKPALALKIDSGRTALLKRDLQVVPGTTYLVRARVKASDRTVLTVGRRRMAYSGGGRWQTMADLVSGDGPLPITLQSGGLQDGTQPLEVSELSLRPLSPPAVPQRPSFGSTSLATNRAPRAFLVIPADAESYLELGRRVQAALRDSTGLSFPIVTDREVTGEGPPIIREPYRNCHLILFGRLANNRALWPAYNRFLAAVDGYYPGGDGYVVRTAANVLRNGVNHLVVGGSSEKGSARAAARFIEIVSATLHRDQTTLPWLLDVVPEGDCLAAFQADEQRWRPPEDVSLPQPEPGYKTVIRWYMNTMGYYWSGWDSYRQRARAMVRPILADQAITHHYIIEFFIRAYDMIDDSDLLSAEEKRGIDALILKNFWEFLTGGDLNWMTNFAPPYDDMALVNRHQVAPWLADLMMADFLHDYFPLQDALAEVVAYRRAEKHPVFRHLVGERWQPSIPSLSGRHDEEIVAALFRYALHHERYEFFERGHAARALALESLTDEHCVSQDCHLLLGIVAHYYRDGRYVALRERFRGPTRLFQDRYVNGVRRYSPGRDIPPKNPDSLAGVRMLALQPHNQRRMRGWRFASHANPAAPPEQTANGIFFRGGFAPREDFLSLATLGGYNGAITKFNALGRNFLGGSTSYFEHPEAVESYCNLNALSVLRTDRWVDDAKPYAGAAVIEWLANLARRGGVGITIRPFMGTSWQREILWLGTGLFLVRDQVTAVEDGSFALSIGWRPRGTPSWDGEHWLARQGAATFRLTPLSSTFRVEQNVDAFRRGEDDKLFFRHAAEVRLRGGETATAMTVLQVYEGQQPPYRPRWVSDEMLVLEPVAAVGGARTVFWGGIDEEGLVSDARAAIVGLPQVDLLAFRSTTLGDQVLPTSERLRSATLDPVSGKLAFHTVSGQDDAPPALAAMLPASFVEQVLAKTAPTGGNQSSAALPAAPPLADESAAWQTTWTYDGLRFPALISPGRTLPGGILDLGREYDLAEVRSILTGRGWAPAPLPQDLRWAKAGEGGRPPADDAAWQPLPGKAEWRAGVETGNYGKAIPHPETFQVWRLEGVRARFIRGPGAGNLRYYRRDRQEARTPIRLEVGAVDAAGHQEILVAPRIWPPFLRARQREDTVLALLDSEGREILRHLPSQNIQQVRWLQHDRSGERRLMVLTQDARLAILERNGRIFREMDLFAMHDRFNKDVNRKATRHPAGGYTLPFSLGLWRPDPSGNMQIVVARYHSYTFLDGRGAFQGVLGAADYVLSAMLPYGLPSLQGGGEQQYVLGRGGLTRLDGDPTPRLAADVTGTPQIYDFKRFATGGRISNTVDGTPVFLFQPVSLGTQQVPQFLLIAREGVIGLFDRAAERMAFCWIPPGAPRAAAVLEDAPERLRIAAVTEDDMLWMLTWENAADKLASFRTRRLEIPVRAITALPGNSSDLLLAGARGLYRLDGFARLVRLAVGSFQDVGALPCAAGPRRAPLVAATTEGRILRLDFMESGKRGVAVP